MGPKELGSSESYKQTHGNLWQKPHEAKESG